MTGAERQVLIASVADAYGCLAKAVTEAQRASKNLTQAVLTLRTVLLSIDPLDHPPWMQPWLDAKEAAK